MYELMDEIVFYVYEDNNQIYYENITKEWLKNRNTKFKEIKDARYVIKNGKRYYVNKINKIVHKNREVENAKWYVDLMGGKIVYLPTISEKDGIQCADYKYYSSSKGKWYYLEEKETNGRGKSVFYHALQNKDKQAKIFLIDCTNSFFTNKEIYEQINKVFKYKETQYVDTIIIKNGHKLFGIFKKGR